MIQLDLKECGSADPEHHWYYKSKARYLFSNDRVKNLNPSIILDVGAGSAYFLKEAQKIFANAQCVAMDPNYTDDQIGFRDGVEYTKTSGSIQADLYLMVDVLEHIEDDLSVLTDYVKRAPSGSLFLISVPAFEFLWSPHDIFLGHFRRYTLKSLKVLVVSSGLDCVEAKYLFGPIFPLVFLIRKIKNLKQTRPSNSDMKKPTPLVNFILTNVLKRTGWPNKNGVAGTSAFVVARKN